MNKAFFYFLLMAASFSAHSQYVYVPMPLADGQWRYRFTSVYQSNVTINDYLLIGSNADTTIDGKIYKKILRRDNTEQGQTPFSFPLQSVVAEQPDFTFAAMREENKRVYMHYGGNDTLIYDFNRIVGDTLPTVFNITPPGNPSQLYEIIKVDTVNISGSQRKRFVAKSLTVVTGDTIRVIEGIGSDRGLFMNNISGNYGLYTLTPEFHCLNAPGVYYSPNNGACTHVWPFGTPASIGETPTADNAQLYPNPFKEHILLRTQSTGSVSVYSLAGARVLHQTVAVGDAAIGTSYLAAGSYLVIVRAEDGEIRLRQILVKQ